MKISILVDTPQSWILPYAVMLRDSLIRDKHFASLVHHQEEILNGDIAFFLGCTRIVKPQYLKYNRNNIVIHPSALPKGRGFSPLAWQLIEGINDIPICLFEATSQIDAGPIYLRDMIHLDGSELNEEIKRLQGEKILGMCMRYIHEYHLLKPQPQQGEPTSYPRRTAEDSELDIYKPLAELFPLLRVVDNTRYPAFFYINGHKYVLYIERVSASSSR